MIVKLIALNNFDNFIWLRIRQHTNLRDNNKYFDNRKMFLYEF